MMTREETINDLQTIVDQNKQSVLVKFVHVGILIHALKYLKEQDAELVRCKDCKYSAPGGHDVFGKPLLVCKGDWFNSEHDFLKELDGFCDEGVRKE